MSSALSFTIRPAVNADCQTIARIQVDSYRSAYAPILPAAYLAQFSYAEQAQDWRDLLAAPGDQVLLVAQVERAGGPLLVGYALGRPRAEGLPGCDGELVALHVAAAWKRRGAGRALTRAMAQHLRGLGCRGLGLWVLADNLPARAFYQHLGGQQAGEQSFSLSDDEHFREVGYTWPEIQTLCDL